MDAHHKRIQGVLFSMISVIIPTYNREKELLRSLDSVRNQTFRDIEIIVVDDGSTDATESAVTAIQDERIRYIKHEENRGGGAARNTGINNARGEYIAFQDSDDVWYPDKLEVEYNCLREHDADIVFCKMNKIEDGKSVKIVPDDYFEGFLKQGSNVYGIGTPTLLGKSEVFKTNAFDERLPRFQELELLIRLSSKYRIYCCDTPLMDNYYDRSASATSGNAQKLLAASTIINEKYPKLRSQCPGVSNQIARTLFIQSYRNDVAPELRKEMLGIAVKVDLRPKTIMRFLAIKTGVFPFINKQAAALSRKRFDVR